jgi:transcriptional regulator with XRE-family HTH domain
MTVREMRLGRGWSQEELAELSGLSVRTIQRIENGRVPGLASAAALAAVFDVDADVLRTAPAPEPPARTFFDAIRVCLRKYATFAGGAERTEYWWFMLFVVLVGAVATLVSETLGAIVLLLLALPLLAAGSRRLHDTGHSGWWQLLALVPFGAVVPLVMLAMPTL